LIEGEVKRITREKHPCPDDGVHRKGKDGNIKGVKSIWIGDRLVPRGSVGFYWHDNGDTGYKVYFAFPSNKTPWFSKRRVVEKAYDTMKVFYEAGLSPKPIGIENVKIKVRVDSKWVKAYVWALEMQHIWYDEKKWLNYAMGRPYEWGEEPGNNPKGYLEFVEKVKAFQKKNRLNLSASTWKDNEVPKLGDCVYCTKQKRFYLVDID